MALPETEQELMKLREDTLAEIKRRGGAEQAPNYASRLSEIDTKLASVRALSKNAPRPDGGSGTSTGTTDPQFNADLYLKANPDVAAEVDRLRQSGDLRAPEQIALDHWNSNGKAEGRSMGFSEGAPTGGTPATGGPDGAPNSDAPAPGDRAAAQTRYKEAANRLKTLKPGTPEYDKNAAILRDLGTKYGWNWQDNLPKGYTPPASTGAPGGTTTPGGTPGTSTGPGGGDPSAGGATSGINLGNLPAGIPSELIQGLQLGKSLYPDGSLGRLNIPEKIGPLQPGEKIQMIDENGIPKVDVLDVNQIPQIKELTTAADEGNLKSISQWEDYYTKTQEKDANIEAALGRAMKFADEGYSSQDMNAKRAKSNRVIDEETNTALRDMRNDQGAAGNFGGVAAARQKDMRKDSLLRKAMTESDLLAGDADFRLNANNQAGSMATNAFQTYNAAQQAGLSGATAARSTVADERLRREMANADTQGKNASNYLTGQTVRGSQQAGNADRTLGAQQSNQQAQGTNAQLQQTRDFTNKDIEASNITREQETTKTNMGQSEKEKALQAGTGIGYWEYLTAAEQQRVLAKIQEKLLESTKAGL